MKDYILYTYYGHRIMFNLYFIYSKILLFSGFKFIKFQQYYTTPGTKKTWFHLKLRDALLIIIQFKYFIL